MPQPRSTTDRSQCIASLEENLQHLRQTIEQHECRPARDPSFRCTAIAAIDHISSIVAHLVRDPSRASFFAPRQGSQAVTATSTSTSSCGFTIFQFSLPVPDVTPQRRRNGKGTRNNLSTFCKRIPQSLEAWQECRDDLGLSTANGIRAAFSSLVQLGVPAQISEPSNDQNAIKNYIINKQKPPFSRLSSLDDLIFLGACSVAPKFGIGTTVIDEATSQYLSHDGISRTVSQHYRNVPRKISNWMNELYKTCGCAAFELFLHANRTVSSYDSLARSHGNVFCNRVQPLIPIELRKKDRTNLAFYLPFLVWVSILLNVKVDCFDQIRDTFQIEEFKHPDFKQCLSSLSQGRPEASLALAQWAHNARPVEIDAAGANTTCTKRSAPHEPRRNPKRRRTRPPQDPVAPHHATAEQVTERSIFQGSDAAPGHPRPGAMDVSHVGAQQLSVPGDDDIVHSSQTAVFEHPMHCNPGHEPPGQLSAPPEIHPYGYAHAAGDIDAIVSNVDSPDIMDSLFPRGVPKVWSPEDYSGQYTDASGCGAAVVDSVWAVRETGSGQIGGVEHCFSL